MATTDQIAELRRLVAEPDETTYGDLALSDLIDANGLKGAAKLVWQQKAAGYATLVNVSESGSSRSLGDLHKNALAMAAAFGAEAVVETVEGTGIRIRRLKRT